MRTLLGWAEALSPGTLDGSRLRLGSLFSGVGGLDVAVEAFFGAQTVWHAEIDPAPSKVLAARWPGVPNLGDVTKVDWSTVEPVDVLCGGFPCQDVSFAGRRQGLKSGTRSGLWSEFAEAIDVLKPKVVVIENVRGLLSAEAESSVEPCSWCLGDGGGKPPLRALGAVLGDLADLGFDAEWGSLLAADVGAPHNRFRVFIVAYRHNLGDDRRWGVRGGIEQPSHGRVRPRIGQLFDTPDTRPEAPNSSSHRVSQPAGLGNQVRALLRTPAASELDGGLIHPDVARANGQTLRLSAQLMALHEATPGKVANPRTGSVFPTCRASRGSATEVMHQLASRRGTTSERMRGVFQEVTNWGKYGPAVHLWESLTRVAPSPTVPDGRNGGYRLNAKFPEWMMGYPDGWVTDILGRLAAIRACGNGVVAQQAVAALNELWSRVLVAVR